MKTIIFTSLLILSITTALAQGEIEIQTKSIKIENFISYIAGQEIKETEQRLYFAIEMDTAGIQPEVRFYLEQGIKLLAARLSENSRIAIGTYGSLGQVILPYTEISNLNNISNLITNAHIATSTSLDDGIDLAYKTAALQQKEDVINTVFLLRNSHAKEAIIAQTVEIAVTPQEKKVKNQREQAKAATHSKLGGAIALTALTILPDLLEIIKD